MKVLDLRCAQGHLFEGWFASEADEAAQREGGLLACPMCGDADVQRLTWEAYMNKRLVRARPLAHLRIFFKDLAHLLGLGPARSSDSHG